MRKLLIALVIAAQPAIADSYLISLSPESVSKLAQANIPAPESSVLRGTQLWGVVPDDSPHVSSYMDEADTIVAMSRKMRRKLEKECGVIDDLCASAVLSESGHD